MNTKAQAFECPNCGTILSRWRLMRCLTYTRIYCPSCRKRLRVSGRCWSLELCCAACSALVGVVLLAALAYLYFAKGLSIVLAIVFFVILDGVCWLLFEYCMSVYVERKRSLALFAKRTELTTT
jgi:hypothetical protein